jgi:hypothetical protein
MNECKTATDPKHKVKRSITLNVAYPVIIAEAPDGTEYRLRDRETVPADSRFPERFHGWRFRSAVERHRLCPTCGDLVEGGCACGRFVGNRPVTLIYEPGFKAERYIAVCDGKQIGDVRWHRQGWKLKLPWEKGGKVFAKLEDITAFLEKM